MANEQDILNTAISRAAEIMFKAAEGTKRLIPNPLGEVGADTPRLKVDDIKRLLEK